MVRKFIAVAVLAIFAIAAPGLAVADSVSYLQGQTSTLVTGASQAQVYIGFAAQSQGGAAQNAQQQVSLNHADSATAVSVVIFGFPVLSAVGVQAVNANGANSQAQGASYIQGQTGFGLALGVQSQGVLSIQTQSQVSTGTGSN